EIGYFEPGGGYVRPEACISAQLKRGLELGGVTRLGTTVRNIDQMESGVAIATDDETIYAEHVIVAAGAWAPALLGGPFQPLLTPRRQFMNWFPVEAQFATAWESGPVFIWAHGAGAEDFFYGFPSLPGSGTIKTAGEQYRDRVEPETMKRVVDAEESRAMYAEHVAGRLNGLDPVAARAVTCLYTVTPDSAFVIDRHPDA
ncbi:FAD-dependent oxidoreductase, partial [Corallococcus exiguus]